MSGDDHANAPNRRQGSPARPKRRRATRTAAVPTRGRADSRETLDRLTAAVGRLMAEDEHLKFNLTDVARAAECSSATVYRYFHSVDEAIDAYLAGFTDDIRGVRHAREVATRTGLTGLRTLAEDWVGIVERWGPALIHVRSPEGFLARHRAQDPVVRGMSEVVLDAIGSALDELGCEHHDIEFALLLWNAIFDPREVLDLQRVLGWTPRTVSTRLNEAFVAALTATNRDSGRVVAIATRPDAPTDTKGVDADDARPGVGLGRQLRAVRRRLGYSLADVSAATGLSMSWLSRVELGRIDISFNRLIALTGHYGVSVADLVGPTEPPGPHIVRRTEWRPIMSAPEGFEVIMLAAGRHGRMLPTITSYRPGVPREDFVATRGEEFMLVLEGSVLLEFDDGPSHSLGRGDSAYYAGMLPHRLTAAGQTQAVVLAVATPPW
jgi:AcrR family transcriptional regulator